MFPLVEEGAGVLAAFEQLGIVLCGPFDLMAGMRAIDEVTFFANI